MKTLLSGLLILLFATSLYATEAQKAKYTVSGVIRDSQSRQTLPGATLMVEGTIWGTATLPDGSYSLTLPEGDYVVKASFVGYNSVTFDLSIQGKSVRKNIMLDPSSLVLNAVEISAERPDANVTSTQMSVQKLNIKTIERLPAFMGEVDVIKSIQLLPGITSTSEGGSGFSVRGGSSDQNLVLMDMASVYNVSHLLGFFSVFNHDAVETVTLFKGDIPPYAGGRLSSYLEVDPKYGNNERFKTKAGIGTVLSRLTVEGPINERSTFLASGRRMYADVFFPLSSNEGIKDTKLNFYDLNASYRYIINDKNRIFLTGYHGNDAFKTSFSKLIYGNSLATFHWNNLVNDRLTSDIYATWTKYSYEFGGGPVEDQQISLKSRIEDLGLKWIMKYKVSDNVEALWGADGLYHTIAPGDFSMEGEESFFNDTTLQRQYALESGLFVGLNPNVNDKLKLKLGLRLNMLNNIGAATVYDYNNQFEAVDSTMYGKGEVFNSYYRLEPRIGFTYLVRPDFSIKGSYNRNYQFMQLARNSVGGTPFDIWFMASPNIKPQRADQYSIGLFKNLYNNNIELSLEGFYKDYANVVDFKDFANLGFNPKLEGDVRVGYGWAYGTELMAKFTYNRWNGWLAYTLSRSERKVEGVNEGKAYVSPYDKTHDLSLVANYQINKRLSLSANWVYATGQPFTGPVGKYELSVGNTPVPIYSDRNELRFEDYHRLDVSATYQLNKNTKSRYDHSLNVSIYNVYNRHNTWAINYISTTNDPYILEGEKTYLLPFLPAITYNLSF